MRELAIDNADVASPTLRIPEGRYSKLYVVVEGTNTATAVAVTDLGIMNLHKNGLPIVGSVECPNIMHFGNLHGGRVGWSSTASSDLFLIIPIFCADPSDPENVLLVGDQDLCQLTVTWGGNFNTRLSSGDIKVCGELSDGVQKYIHKYAQYNYSGAGPIIETIPGENFLRMMIRDMDDTNITRIMVDVDGQEIHSGTRIETLYASLLNTRIEDVGGTEQIATGEITADVAAEIPIVQAGTWGEILNDSLRLTMIASASISPEIMVTMADYTPPEAALTRSMVAERRERKLKFKRQHFKGRPVSVYNQIVAQQNNKPIAS